jgi:AsmA protein
MNLSANIRGTLGESAVTTRLRLTGTRRADFVPEQLLNAEAECFATATHVFHSFEDLRCSWPPAGTANTPTIALTGSIPSVRNLREARLQAGTSGIPASTLISWLRVASPHVPDDLKATGTLSGSLFYDGRWQGDLTLRDAGLTTTATGTDSLVTGDVLLSSTARPPDTRQRRRNPQPAPQNTPGFQLAPASLDLGGHDHAALEGHLDVQGYTLHLSGMVTNDRLEALTHALPALSEALTQYLPANHPAGPFHVDVTATRPWATPSISPEASATPPSPLRKPKH